MRSAEDPAERVNLADARADDFYEFMADLQVLLRAEAEAGEGEPVEIDPDVLEALRSFGDVR